MGSLNGLGHPESTEGLDGPLGPLGRSWGSWGIMGVLEGLWGPWETLRVLGLPGPREVSVNLGGCRGFRGPGGARGLSVALGEWNRPSRVQVMLAAVARAPGFTSGSPGSRRAMGRSQARRVPGGGNEQRRHLFLLAPLPLPSRLDPLRPGHATSPLDNAGAFPPVPCLPPWSLQSVPHRQPESSPSKAILPSQPAPDLRHL